MNRSEMLAKLRRFEKIIPKISFTNEDSNLGTLNFNFPSIGGKDFSSWISYYSSIDSSQIMEIGGGPSQVAARDILKQFPTLKYVGVDKRPPTAEVAEKLSGNNYSFIESGISQLFEKLKKNDFDIVFAHNVAPHLPNPFWMIEQAYLALKPQGLFFCNGIIIYEIEWEKIHAYLLQKKYDLSYGILMNLGNDYTKQGLINLAIALRKNSATFKSPIMVTNYESEMQNPDKYVSEQLFFAQTVK